jgi:hypothetical protein
MPDGGVDMPKKQIDRISSDEASLSVSRTVLGDTNLKSKRKNERIKVRPFVTNPAHVSVKMGATIPTADYAGVRLDIMLTVPCYVEEIVSVYKQTRKMVEDLIETEIDEIQSDIDREKKG